jgi:hypothetical protein
VSYENNEQNEQNGQNEKRNESVYSQRLKAGKKRTYFFDVRTTRSNDYFVTLTESTKRFTDGGYDRHKIFLYKEDFNKFLKALEETINHVKTELMPDFDFDAFKHEPYEPYEPGTTPENTNPTASASPIVEDFVPTPTNYISTENDTTNIEVDKW